MLLSFTAAKLRQKKEGKNKGILSGTIVNQLLPLKMLSD